MVRPCLVLLGLGVCLLGVSHAYSNKAVGLDLPNSGRRNERGLHKHATTRREQLMELTQDQLVDVLLQFDAMPVATADTAYWWRYNNSDCAYHDLPEAQWCIGESLSSCKAKYGSGMHPLFHLTSSLLTHSLTVSLCIYFQMPRHRRVRRVQLSSRRAEENRVFAAHRPQQHNPIHY